MTPTRLRRYYGGDIDARYAAFAEARGLRESHGAPCPRRLTGGRHLRRTECPCEALRPWAIDHERLWVRDGRAVLFTTEPYGPLMGDARRRLETFAGLYGLAVHVGRTESPWNPGRTVLVEIAVPEPAPAGAENPGGIEGAARRFQELDAWLRSDTAGAAAFLQLAATRIHGSRPRTLEQEDFVREARLIVLEYEHGRQPTPDDWRDLALAWVRLGPLDIEAILREAPYAKWTAPVPEAL